MLSRVAALIGDHKKMEEALRQSQKMDAVGQLAGGIAHDFNNVLNVIVGYAHLMLGGLSKSSPDFRRVDEIRKAAERGASLSQRLLAFSRKQHLQPRVVDFAEILRDMDQMIRRVIGGSIEVVTHIDTVHGHVLLDPSQIEQVILNLAVNARDAMPDGGVLSLNLSELAVSESHAKLHGIPAGAYVQLAVTDNGHGMTAEVRERAFEPFFTTKEVGQGTGLGLAIVYGIVQQSGGHIWLYSEPGSGTTFKLYFPSVQDPVQPRHTPQTLIATGDETVLLVEDDPAVRSLVAEILESAGYHVIAAQDAKDGVRIAEEHDGRIHLLLTDMVMPHITGPEVARGVRAVRPDIVVVFMSGFTGHSVNPSDILDSAAGFVPKPFSPEDLCAAVRTALDV
jgi:nitrogen-specific signal transduction histidine kinase/CheY-like chemotaxis protein